MDYASEECMVMFTNGQVDLMRNVLQGPRSGLLENVSGTHEISTGILHISPNPANDILTLQLPDMPDEMKLIRIMDLNGKMMTQPLDLISPNPG
jgi:hypothetical protein